jgi:hypothetical protein
MWCCRRVITIMKNEAMPGMHETTCPGNFQETPSVIVGADEIANISWSPRTRNEEIEQTVRAVLLQGRKRE